MRWHHWRLCLGPVAALVLLCGCSQSDPQAELRAWREQRLAELKPFPPVTPVLPPGCLVDVGARCFEPLPSGQLSPFDAHRLEGDLAP